MPEARGRRGMRSRQQPARAPRSRPARAARVRPGGDVGRRHRRRSACAARGVVPAPGESRGAIARRRSRAGWASWGHAHRLRRDDRHHWSEAARPEVGVARRRSGPWPRGRGRPTAARPARGAKPPQLLPRRDLGTAGRCRPLPPRRRKIEREWRWWRSSRARPAAEMPHSRWPAVAHVRAPSAGGEGPGDSTPSGDRSADKRHRSWQARTGRHIGGSPTCLDGAVTAPSSVEHTDKPTVEGSRVLTTDDADRRTEPAPITASGAPQCRRRSLQQRG